MELRSLALAVGFTVASVVAGIWVAAYLTVPNPQMAIEGGNFLAFDPEIGVIARPSHHARRTEGATPNRPALSYDIYTDERGARVDGPAQQRSPGISQIVTVGCSFTWGQPIESHDTYASTVARELGASNENLALAGYATTQSLLMLRRNRDLKPRLVIYGFIYAHLDRNVEACGPTYHPFCMGVSHVAWDADGKPYIAPPLSDGARRAYDHLMGAGWNPLAWLAHGLDVIRGRIEYAWYRSRIPDRSWGEKAFAYLLDEMRRDVADMGAELLVVYIPTGHEPAPPELGRHIGTTRLLDLTEVFERHRREGGAPLYVVDDGHPNEVAHALIAREITRYVRENRLLPAGP